MLSPNFPFWESEMFSPFTNKSRKLQILLEKTLHCLSFLLLSTSTWRITTTRNNQNHDLSIYYRRPCHRNPLRCPRWILLPPLPKGADLRRNDTPTHQDISSRKSSDWRSWSRGTPIHDCVVQSWLYVGILVHELYSWSGERTYSANWYRFLWCLS